MRTFVPLLVTVWYTEKGETMSGIWNKDRRDATGEMHPSLLNCALLAINGCCPPERAMYYCTFGEDDSECDCVFCWTKYLEYVANGRRCDPYASMRVDE